MKVTILRNEKNLPIGWEMESENDQEINTINSIRNMQYFGIDGTAIRYNGRRGGNDTTNAGILSWKQAQYIKDGTEKS